MSEQPEWFRRYCGMSYEQCSREGAELIAKAHESGAWYDALDRLIFLRGQMQFRSAGGDTREAR